jgi:membrane protease YdiL (CAAX protease family)
MEKTVCKQIWGPWATTGFGLVIGVTFFLTQIFVFSVYISIKLYSDFHLNELELAEDLITNGFVIALSTCATAIICIGTLLLIIKLRKGATISEYLALTPITLKTLLVLLVISTGFIILSDGLTYLLGRSIIPQFMIDAYRTSVFPIIFWVALVLAAPLFEETFFRGFLFEGFRRSRIGNAGAVCLTALMWTSIHHQYGFYELTIILMHSLISCL